MSVTNQPQLQDYLPAIALPILVIASLTAPPFPGRGIIFASLIITVDYLSLTSPWPANEGETRPSRYGISSSWLLVLPVLEKLLLHVPEREFWRIKAPLDGVNGRDQGKADKPSTSHHQFPVPPPWTWQKLCWAISLASTPRGVGWNFASHRVRSDYEAAAQKRIGRLAFVGASLRKALCAYLALDAVLVFGQDLAVPDAWLWEWHKTWDILIAEFLMLVCTYAGMKVQFEALAAVSVGLGFSKPEVRISGQKHFSRKWDFLLMFDLGLAAPVREPCRLLHCIQRLGKVLADLYPSGKFYSRVGFSLSSSPELKGDE